MRYLFTLPLLLLASPAFAVICKSVDAQGVVSYSDVPASECAHQVTLPQPSTFSPLPESADGPGPAARHAGHAAYTMMRIEQPANGGTVRNNQGRVPFSVALQPALKSGDKIRVTLDGVVIQPPFGGQSGVLRGVQRGTHTLGASVVNSAGQVVIQAASVTFTLHQAIQSAKGAANTGSGSASSNPYGPVNSTNTYNPQSTGNEYTPQNGANYQPSAPDYSPNYTSPAHTQAPTHPSYAPHYQP